VGKFYCRIFGTLVHRAFLREMQKLLNAEIAENFRTENAERTKYITRTNSAVEAFFVERIAESGCPQVLRAVNILKRP
jgi:hypothetical protein